MKKSFEIYTDGACSGNPGKGGWAAILIWGDVIKEIAGYEDDTTNNRMELRAALEALKIVKEPCKIIIYTDSQYLKRGMSEWINGWLQTNWNKGKVKNIDLWLEIYNYSSNHEIEWRWVKAHNGNPMNEAVDQLAKSMISKKAKYESKTLRRSKAEAS